jgi:predicted  nucleic acid-binding Zn-ribbon protein
MLEEFVCDSCGYKLSDGEIDDMVICGEFVCEVCGNILYYSGVTEGSEDY